MPPAMLIRVKRLETVLRRGPALRCAEPGVGHVLMSRLAVHPDLFREFAVIAEEAQSGADDAANLRQRVRLLCEGLAAREARAGALRVLSRSYRAPQKKARALARAFEMRHSCTN